ncbi:amidase [Thermoproteus tenax]|uniref:Asp-tRNAAsn/Glu-tRNAGln amidotransferase A subunit n=1 Tax=Thermoproteus tenax (strain ATCC 35583 / DSM 2078 / JCM 9277 / NBRC 100435 / Kra 1) TaxID=768679 RepID=G4RQ46_THETK|nr:amidase [Thermoproteus tenax]CCC80683.1 Asp-tRNAAsn/Glu-tRNAGln amidotransferase A subunit [Thermoproteus tenax Kra 1]
MIKEIVDKARADPDYVVRTALESLKRAEGQKYNYFLALDRDLPKRAERASLLRSGRRLLGVVVAVKDNIDVAGLPTTNGAPYAREVPELTAPIVTALEEEGALVLGKTNMHELALGATNVNPHFGPTLNPRDPSRITGGSSGGSAGAVALGIAHIALGTDTGGSVRIPASLCGVVGYKPPYGALSLEGVRPLAPSLDHLGFFTSTVKDLVYLMSVLRGLRAEPPPRFRFGILKGIAEPDEYVEKAFWRAVAKLESAGGERWEVEVNARKFSYARAAILLAEAASVNWGYLRRHEPEMGRDVATLLKVGASLPAVAYLRALEIQREAKSYFNSLLKRYDVLVTPTTAIAAPPVEEANTIAIRPKLLAYTELFNLAGLPAISVPAPAPHLPVGVQLVSSDEERLLSIASKYEEA